MASMIDAYNSEFIALCDTITSQIAQYKLSKDTDSIQALNREIECSFSQANDLIKEIEVEIRSLDAKSKVQKTQQIAANKSKQTELRAQFDIALRDFQRANLIGSGKIAADGERFLTSQERINKQNESIMNAQRSVAETEGVGMDTMNELVKNREKISGAQSKATKLKGDLDRSEALADSMLKRDKCCVM